jgi:hypothetical protein
MALIQPDDFVLLAGGTEKASAFDGNEKTRIESGRQTREVGSGNTLVS